MFNIGYSGDNENKRIHIRIEEHNLQHQQNSGFLIIS